MSILEKILSVILLYTIITEINVLLLLLIFKIKRENVIKMKNKHYELHIYPMK
jgi:hypothetical protein